MLVNLLHCVTDSNKTADRTSDVASNVEQRPFSVNFDDHLVHDCGTHVTEMTCHLLASENFTRELTLTDGTSGSVGFTHTVTCVLHVEIPTFDCALEPLAFADRYRVDKLPNFKVSRAQIIPNRKQILFGHLKLSKVLFWWNIVFQQVSNLRLHHLMRRFVSTANLNRINAIFLFCLDLGNLTSVDLNHSARL